MENFNAEDARELARKLRGIDVILETIKKQATLGERSIPWEHELDFDLRQVLKDKGFGINYTGVSYIIYW
jgi:hypothetical protein